MDETKLVERAVSGAQAFGDLARFHRPALLRVAIRILGDTPEAEDAVQEALIDALLSLATWEQRGTFKAWLTGYVRQECAKIKRERASISTVSLDSMAELSGGGDPLDIIIAKEEEEESRAAIARLPRIQRQAFEMFADGASYDEIARNMGISAGAVRVGMCRARKSLSNKSVTFRGL